MGAATLSGFERVARMLSSSRAGARRRAYEVMCGGLSLRRLYVLDVEERGPVGGLARAVVQDELLDHVPGRLVAELHRRRLHEVGARADQWAGDAAVQRELRAPQCVDHDAGGVRAVPDLELELDVERHVPERLPLEADLRPLAVLEPGHVVAGADVDVLLVELLAHLRLDG